MCPNCYLQGTGMCVAVIVYLLPCVYVVCTDSVQKISLSE